MAPAWKKAGVDKILVHTGQHYDHRMSEIFFSELDIPRPDYISNLVKGSHATETASMLVFLDDILRTERPDVTLVYGDVNSTIAAALASAKLGIPVAHVEAGLRCGATSNPEEINRRVADVLSAVQFPHISEARDSLLAEGYSPADVHLVGDVHLDAIESLRARGLFECQKGDYLLVTLHRAENADNPERLKAIITALEACGRRVLFPLHPRTRQALAAMGILERAGRPGRIEWLEPQGYASFLRLLAGCDLLLSDSGGARREAYLLGKRVISLIELVWVPSMVSSGWERVCGADAERILAGLKSFPEPADHPPLFGDGHAADRIVSVLTERFGR